MITDADIKKLKKVFATKDDLKRFATKDDLKRFATKDDLKRFATKDDLKRFATKDDIKELRKEIIEIDKANSKAHEKIINMVVDGTNRILEKIDDVNKEVSGHTIRIGNHEDRLQKVEHKVFPQT